MMDTSIIRSHVRITRLPWCRVDLSIRRDDNVIVRQMYVCLNEKIERMRILYDSPVGKIRVWISWLIKLAEEGKKWHTWLDSRVKIFQQILNIVTGEHFITSENVNVKRENELVEKTVDEIVPDGDEEKSPTLRGEINRTQDVVGEEPSPSTQAIPIVNEILNEALNKSRQWTDEEHSSEVLGTLVAFNKIPWPIGVPWVPQVFDKNKKKTSKLKKLKFVKKIALPQIKEKIMKFMNRINYQAIIYRSLYKHCQEIINRAHKDVTDGQIISRKNDFAHMEIP